MADFGKPELHSHIFFQNETYFSWISLTSWLFILIFRAESGKKNNSMRFLTKNENLVRKIEFVKKHSWGGLGGPQPPRNVFLDDF